MDEKKGQNINNGNGNLQVGGNFVNFEGDIVINAFEEDKVSSVGIVSEIIDYLVKKVIPKSGRNTKNDYKTIIGLNDKIRINSDGNKDVEARIRAMITNLWDRKKVAESQLQGHRDQEIVKCLKEYLASKYSETRSAGLTIEETIETITTNMLSPKNKEIPEFRASAKAIILCFFEYCDVGEKTEREISEETTIFD